MDLTSLTLSTAADMIKRLEISPLELTRAHLTRIEKLDPQLNTFITLTAEDALDHAREMGESIARGGYRGPLHGIPLALKDLYETKGVRTTAGSKFLSNNIPNTDAHVVEKLNAAGGILLGKLNMHEIALGVTNENPHYGDCKNPWDLTRLTGGSSGGSGAALAAELCLGSLGSDTGGSIRIPASLCGIVGLKPTFGRVSKRGVFPLSWNLDHIGPMTRQVKDAAIMLEVIAGYDPDDPYSADTPTDNYTISLERGVHGWRVALANDRFFTKADPDVLAALKEAAGQFERLGAFVTEVEIPNALEAALANLLMLTSDAAAFHQQRLETNPQIFGADVLQRLQSGASFTSSEYILARHTQTMMRHQFKQFFENYDLLLTPATPSAAPKIGAADAVERARQLGRFTGLFNLTGLPAMSLPCGFTSFDLPIGLQIIAPGWGEARLLRAAFAYEQSTDWHLRKHPPIPES